MNDDERDPDAGLTYRGRTQSIRAWARELGIGESAIRYRLKNGWTVARTLSQRVAPRIRRQRRRR